MHAVVEDAASHCLAIECNRAGKKEGLQEAPRAMHARQLASGPAQVVVLLNGRPATEYTFSAGVFKTACAPARPA